MITSNIGPWQWQEIVSEIAKEWGKDEVELLNESVADLRVKYNEKKRRLVGQRAMIVDDSKMLRMVLEDWLSRAGINVVARAENGYDAVKLFNSDEFYDYTFLNVAMPELDGIDALNDFKKDRPTRIIMVTSTKTPELLLKSIKNGAHHALFWPFDFSMVLSVMSDENSFSTAAYDKVAARLGVMKLDGNGELSQKQIFELVAAASMKDVDEG